MCLQALTTWGKPHAYSGSQQLQAHTGSVLHTRPGGMTAAVATNNHTHTLGAHRDIITQQGHLAAYSHVNTAARSNLASHSHHHTQQPPVH